MSPLGFDILDSDLHLSGSAIYGFEEVVSTANKMLKIAKILGCEVVVTEQNPRALGSTAPEVDLEILGPLLLPTVGKTLFSMFTPQVKSILNARPIHNVVLFGIESHICILQTALDLLSAGYGVHVLADGVSSCNQEEVPLALARIRQAGGHITTSESAAFQLFGDAANPNFKAFSSIIKDEKERTKKSLQVLQPRSAL